MAGATAISVGTMNFAEPMTTSMVVDGIAEYMQSQGLNDINDIVRL